MDLSKNLDTEVTQLFQNLYMAAEKNGITTEGFEKRLDKIAAEAKLHNITTKSLGGKEHREAKEWIVWLALQMQRPETRSRVEELKGWYGSLECDMPLELYRKSMRRTLGELTPQSKAEIIELQKKHKKGSQEQYARYPLRKVAELSQEHTKAEYLAAWEFWLLAPPSKERKFMESRRWEALGVIREEHMISLFLEMLKIETHRGKDEKTKRRRAEAIISFIRYTPGEKALDALLECNRYTLNKSFNGDGYDSISSFIVRLLASRRSRKSEDVSLRDDLWKKYKPLVEKRLRNKSDKTPKEDIEILEAAMKIMPK